MMNLKTMHKFTLSDNFGADEDNVCYVGPVPNGRMFGQFKEKNLVCNESAQKAINRLCDTRGFEYGWSKYQGNAQFQILSKTPATPILNLIMGDTDETTIKELEGAYSVCMDPLKRTCVNVFVGRRENIDKKWSVDKFSLFYPDNTIAYAMWGIQWPLLPGYSFRTAVLNGTLNRGDLRGLKNGTLPTKYKFEAKTHGLVISDDSEYEDCAFVAQIPNESTEDLCARIDRLVVTMICAYGGPGGILALSYDPKENQENMSALQSEWELLQRVSLPPPIPPPHTSTRGM